MSLESAMEEERRAVMDILSGINRNRDANSRASSPGGAPVRSLLDIGDKHTAKFILPSEQKKMEEQNARRAASPRGRDIESSYQFDMLPSIEAHALPKRVTQGGKKKKKGAMSSVYGGSLSGRHNSTADPLGMSKSQSPSARLAARSVSPGGSRLNSNSLNLMSDPRKYVTESGKSIDLNNAYRRLSDAALLRSGGSLANLPRRKGSDPTKGETSAPGGGVRLEKDYYADDDDDDEEALESSDEEFDSDASSGDDESSRGRRRRRGSQADSDIGEKLPKSLLAAAEDDRKRLSSDYKVRSLLEPTVTITGPNGEKMAQNKKKGVHPTTSFDQGGASGVSTPVTSDTEADISEIKRAQRMALTMSPITSTPEAHRCIRQIIRGNYAEMQREAEHGLRRQRMYLVATDLSEEAAYALEWTIGTVLRDGDTLLAVYAVDEEVGTGGEMSGGGNGGVGIGEGAKMMRDTAKLVRTLSNDQRMIVDDGRSKSKSRQRSIGPSPLQKSMQSGDILEKTESAEKPDFSNMQKAERQRWHAAEEVSDRIVSLLRKTKLQVRAVIEVFHCKSPKHMITEVIDFLDPTLVILGSRGRSALKGNYLVTKSSVPVMVARKRLRKHSKYKRTNMRFSNVLNNPAVTDEEAAQKRATKYGSHIDRPTPMGNIVPRLRPRQPKPEFRKITGVGWLRGGESELELEQWDGSLEGPPLPPSPPPSPAPERCDSLFDVSLA